MTKQMTRKKVIVCYFPGGSTSFSRVSPWSFTVAGATRRQPSHLEVDEQPLVCCLAGVRVIVVSVHRHQGGFPGVHRGSVGREASAVVATESLQLPMPTQQQTEQKEVLIRRRWRGGSYSQGGGRKWGSGGGGSNIDSKRGRERGRQGALQVHHSSMWCRSGWCQLQQNQ